DRVVVVDPHRTGEGSGQDDLAGVELVAVGGDLVGQPVHAGGRVVQHAGGDAGFLHGLVLEQDARDPAQVHGFRAHRVAADDHGAHRRVVGDGVHDGAAFHLDARIEDLQGGDDVFGGFQHVEDVRVRTLDVLLELERQFHCDARMRVLVPLHGAPGVKDHVVEDDAVVRFGDAGGHLHGAGGQPDLPAGQHAAVGL